MLGREHGGVAAREQMEKVRVMREQLEGVAWDVNMESKEWNFNTPLSAIFGINVQYSCFTRLSIQLFSSKVDKAPSRVACLLTKPPPLAPH